MLPLIALMDIFTVADVVRLLERVQGRPVWMARAVRYYVARTGMVEPSHRIAGDRGARLYTLTDIALLRLAWLLRERYKLHERAVSGVLVYRGDEVRALLTAHRRRRLDRPVRRARSQGG
jgi:DNA-binding transcriptional MerR regulator